MNYSLQALLTPVRNKTKFNFQNIPSSTAETKTNNLNTTQQLNYKTKAFELMDQVTQMKTKQKQYQTQIEILKQNIENVHKQIVTFLNRAQCINLSQALDIIRKFKNYKDFNYLTIKEQNNNLKLRIIQYKQKCQQINQQSQQKYDKIFHKKLQQIQKNSVQQINQSNTQNSKLKNQLKQIKYEYQKIICENSQLKENLQNLRQNMKNSIQKYESIQFAVQQKMHQYIVKLQQYEQIIQRNKRNQQFNKKNEKQKILRQIKQEEQQQQKILKADFSFGKFSQSDFQQVKSKAKNENKNDDIQELQMSIQCYRASIEGLLQENKRLKKALQALYKLKQGQQLPQQIAKQISIMRSIIELNDNIDNI